MVGVITRGCQLHLFENALTIFDTVGVCGSNPHAPTNFLSKNANFSNPLLFPLIQNDPFPPQVVNQNSRNLGRVDWVSGSDDFYNSSRSLRFKHLLKSYSHLLERYGLLNVNFQPAIVYQLC